MSEKTSGRIGDRLGSLQVKATSALIIASATFVILTAAGIYLWLNPVALCRQQTSSLFFGTTIGRDGRVQETDWARFVEEAILPRLPEGFTVLDGQGVWRSTANGSVMREASRVLVVVRPNDAEIDGKLAAIAEDYKTRFRQDSVLRLDQCGAYSF